MVRMQISLTQEQSDRLRVAAAERRVSIAALIREAIDRTVATASATDARARALEAVGRFHSGRTDTSEAHDEVLAEAYAE